MTPRYADLSILMPYIVVLHANIARTNVCIVRTINKESCPLMQAHCCTPDNHRGIQSKTRWIAWLFIQLFNERRNAKGDFSVCRRYEL